MISTILKLGAILTALLAIAIGLVFFSTVITRTGVYTWYAWNKDPMYIGCTPAWSYGRPWKYTFEELYDSNLKGQKAIVTGANSGIGYEAALAMGRLGAEVTLACRTAAKCEQAAQTMRAAYPQMEGTLKTKVIDTNSLESVKRFAEEYSKENDSLDILLLNAGMIYSVKDAKCVPSNEDGIETVFATNYLGHHLLYQGLEKLLLRSKMARVVSTSSMSSFITYSYKVATDLETLNGCSEYFIEGGNSLSYGQTKLAQILWTKKLTRLQSNYSNIYYNAFHPGAVDTPIWYKNVVQIQPPAIVANMLAWLQKECMWSAAEGALTGLFLIVATDQLEKDNIRGRYLHPMAEDVENPMAMDEDLQDRLWEFSQELVKDYLPTVKEETAREQKVHDAPSNAQE